MTFVDKKDFPVFPRLRDASVVKLRFLCAVTICALTVFANAADKPAETKYQTLLEKFAAAYSAMDAKALEPLVSKQILDQCKEQFHQYRKTHQQPELTITGEKPEKDASILASVTLKVNGKDVKVTIDPDSTNEQAMKTIASAINKVTDINVTASYLKDTEIGLYES